jgi:hypothetical protein
MLTILIFGIDSVMIQADSEIKFEFVSALTNITQQRSPTTMDQITRAFLCPPSTIETRFISDVL